MEKCIPLQNTSVKIYEKLKGVLCLIIVGSKQKHSNLAVIKMGSEFANGGFIY